MFSKYLPITDEGLYAELMRFHQSGEEELDDMPWKEAWDEEDAYLLKAAIALRQFIR